MRSLQDAIQATTVAAELSALGGGASVASADPDAPENPADEIARTKALAKAFGHIQSADAAGNIQLATNLTRKWVIVLPTRADFVTTTNLAHWGTVLGSKEGIYVLLGLCRRNP